MRFRQWRDASTYYDSLVEALIDYGWDEDEDFDSFNLRKTTSGGTVFFHKKVPNEEVAELASFLEQLTVSGRKPSIRIRDYEAREPEQIHRLPKAVDISPPQELEEEEEVSEEEEEVSEEAKESLKPRHTPFHEESEHRQAWRRSFRKSEAFKRSQKNYQQSEAGREAQRRYTQTERGKERREAYAKSEKGKARRKEYQDRIKRLLQEAREKGLI